MDPALFASAAAAGCAAERAGTPSTVLPPNTRSPGVFGAKFAESRGDLRVTGKPR